MHFVDSDKSFFISGAKLEDLILSLPIPAHVKEMPTGRYILSNKENLKVYNFTDIEQMIGKTIHDLDTFMRPRWGDHFADSIDVLDRAVADTGKTFFDRDRIFVTIDGVLRLQDMTKIPIYNHNHAQKAALIFTHSHDKTNKVNILFLLNTYIKFYKEKTKISKYFCRYLKIDSLFRALPSISEIRFLLHAKERGTMKDIAKKTCRSIKTCETHVSHINDKLKKGDMRDIVNYLRASLGQKPEDVSL